MSIDSGLNSEVEVRIRNSLKVSGRFTLINQDGSKEIVNGKGILSMWIIIIYAILRQQSSVEIEMGQKDSRG